MRNAKIKLHSISSFASKNDSTNVGVDANLIRLQINGTEFRFVCRTRLGKVVSMYDIVNAYLLRLQNQYETIQMRIQVSNLLYQPDVFTVAVYQGYYDGSRGWFNTKPLIGTTESYSLLSVTDATGGLIQPGDINKSAIVTQNFTPQRTGNYRFFTRSTHRNNLVIDNERVIFNFGGGNFIYATMAMNAGQQYVVSYDFGVSSTPDNSFYCGWEYVRTYPPLPFLSDNAITVPSSFPYGDGTYSIDRSTQESTSTASVWNAFDKLVTGVSGAAWLSRSRYNGGNGLPTSTAAETTVDGAPILGEWIELQCPVSFVLDAFTVRARNASTNQGIPKHIMVAAWTGSAWTSIIEVSDLNTLVMDDNGILELNETVFVDVSTSAAYSLYRLIVRAVILGNSRASVSEWELFETNTLSATDYQFPSDLSIRFDIGK